MTSVRTKVGENIENTILAAQSAVVDEKLQRKSKLEQGKTAEKVGSLSNGHETAHCAFGNVNKQISFFTLSF